MKLSDHLETSGNWVFRWRSYLPLLLIGLSLASLREAKYPSDSSLLELSLKIVSVAVGFFGVGIRAYAVGCAPQRTSGRNTREQIADTLNTSGLYSIVRHPLYLGNTLMWFSVALFAEAWTLAVIILLVSTLYHERIIFAEEAFLEHKFGDSFAIGRRTPRRSGRDFELGSPRACILNGAMPCNANTWACLV